MYVPITHVQNLPIIPSFSGQSGISFGDEFPDLSYTPRLRSFSISGIQWTQSSCPADHLADFFTAISESSSSLESIRLGVEILRWKSLFVDMLTNDNEAEDDTSPTTLDCSQWSSVDTVLSQVAFSSLKMVQIELSALRENDVDPQLMLKSFPTLRSKKKDRVQVILSESL